MIRIEVITLGICTIFSPLLMSAAVVEWNKAFVVCEGEDPQREFSDYEYFYGMGMPYLVVYANKVGLALELFAWPDPNLANANTFVRANAGDIVSKEFIESQSEYFAYAEYGHLTGHTDYTISLLRDETVYLAYESEDANGSTYGWVQLGIGDDGYLIAISSAYDLDGDSIVVGIAPTPEPTGGALLVLGAALLALRRRRVTSCELRGQSPLTLRQGYAKRQSISPGLIAI